MATLSERISVAESQIRTIDGEIKLFRDVKHEHNNLLQNHSNQIQYHEEMFTSFKEVMEKLGQAIEKYADRTEENTQQIRDFKTTATTAFSMTKIFISVAIFMGSGFVSFFVFVCGKILHWW